MFLDIHLEDGLQDVTSGGHSLTRARFDVLDGTFEFEVDCLDVAALDQIRQGLGRQPLSLAKQATRAVSKRRALQSLSDPCNRCLFLLDERWVKDQPWITIYIFFQILLDDAPDDSQGVRSALFIDAT